VDRVAESHRGMSLGRGIAPSQNFFLHFVIRNVTSRRWVMGQEIEEKEVIPSQTNRLRSVVSSPAWSERIATAENGFQCFQASQDVAV